MKSQPSILIVIFVGLLLSIVRGATYHVPVDFRTIQSAIEASSFNGDTIIVAPGTYIENIDYLGKNIYIGSHYIFGNTDASIINRTIIDGNENGSVVTFYGGESRDAVLNGFTITNGNGRHSPGWKSASGGGLYISDSNPSIMNCVIKNNTAFGYGVGGGMLLLYSEAYLSNLIITENLAFKGGGIHLTRSNIEMDQRKRCSIFLNEGSIYNDIGISLSNDSDFRPRIYIDTASVDSLDEYFFDDEFELLDILNAKIEKVPHDLYVSPEGCDNNSGLTPDDPLKTITYALHIIHADSLNPRTIHLISSQFSPAVFSRSLGQVFPLHMRSYVTIEGEGQERTILDLEGTYPFAIHAINYQKYMTIRSMSVINGSNPPGEFDTPFWGVLLFSKTEGTILDDMKFENISIKCFSGFYSTGNPIPASIKPSLIVRNCRFENNTGYFGGFSVGQTLMQNCIISNNEIIDHDHYSNGVSFVSYDSLTEIRVENCSFTNNTNYSDDPLHDLVNMGFYNSRGLKFFNVVNCTFADGNSWWGQSISIYSTDASRLGMKTDIRFVNCILWNDNIPWELRYEENYQNEGLSFLRMAYNDIRSEMWNMAIIGYIDYTYEDTNIDMLPLFNNDYTLQPNSPCIDAGTAFYVYEGDTIVNLSPDEYYGSAPDMGAHEWRPTVGIDDNLLLLPGNVAISSVYPNPFNSSTTIKYQVTNSGKINLSIYDITGRLVKELIDAYVRMGVHSLTMNVSDLASGMYILRLKTKTGSSSRQIALIK